MSTAKKAAKGKSKSKATKRATAAMAPEQGYGGHQEGSRKGKVHQLFDEQGSEAAWVSETWRLDPAATAMPR